MRTTTIPSAAAAGTRKKSGFFGRLVAALADARQRQADREVENYLSRQPDRMLRDIGLSEIEIEDLRRKHQL
jgi:uncharacterized protein YjiS (DUF1127 family)